ncbi:MAG: hypothetical protein A2X28_10925 [Elusimicrobia bacterium GWA2_56_46]|nr:MAG: hypothetical protein A2X28_10925 [Elusimicrobia bacterium GWA2_56_46]OGR55776.1 MAG: hypothetical protein A2X39_10545 [Elusimicrobia bacterium GWC2_56_31]HBB66638.1 hypothetical protein [Elusimicrobiota bacterium]HBW23587.1 hypothetical protein [Elusimicrobiota bacterium]
MISLRSKTLRKVFAWFVSNEDRELTLERCIKLLREKPRNVERVFLKLERERVLKSRRRGKQRYFSAAADTLFYHHYKTIFMKRARIEERLERALINMKGVQSCYAFGGYMNMRGDVDLVVVGDAAGGAVEQRLLTAQADIGRRVNIFKLTPFQFGGDAILRGMLGAEAVQLV